MKRIFVVFALLSICMGISVSAFGKTDEERVDELLSKLTIEEKASLMMHHAASVERLGIRSYNWWNEALHGVARNGAATAFPQPIGMASSFDVPLVYAVFTAVSDEARIKNRIAREKGWTDIYEGVTFWTPNINIFRDPRWGRGMETYGEDPFLTGEMGAAVVRGLQGNPDSDILKAHACAKHFAVHSGPESSRHSFDARVSERDLRETYLPAFKKLVTKAGVCEVMTAYNRFYGEPCAASGRLVNDILRGEWNYQGLVVSDCWALKDLYVPGHHGYSASAAEAAAAVVKNGLNVECGETYEHIPEAVRLGLLTEADVDKCLKRQLLQRFRLGEMDDKSLWDNLPDSLVEGRGHKNLSLRMARESIVLLQNRGNVLPLDASSSVALIGPNVDDRVMMWGNYNSVPEETVTLLDAMSDRVPGLVSFRGCGLVEAGPGEEIPGYPEGLSECFLPRLDEADVLSRLDGIDVVVFAGGISPMLEGEEMPVSVSGFSGGDRTSIELPEVQRRLLKTLHDAGKKVVFVNFSGSAMGLAPETESCDAIVQAWYPGQEGGRAIAEILYGDVNPSGKLPLTFYSSIDDVPEFDNYDMAGRTYRYFKGEPLFPFGFGLSYTSFEYGKASIKNGCISFTVSNTGARDGNETVQLYVSRPDDPEGPVRTLRAFRRIFVPAGKTLRVYFKLGNEMFEWWDPQTSNVNPRPGRYIISYGGSSSEKSLKKISYRYK